MAFWNPTTGVITVKVGTNPNDGTGDSIRNAFITIDNNFANVSSFLSGGAGAVSVDFLTSTITNLTGTIGNITTVNSTTLNSTAINGTSGNFVSNVIANNLNANTGIHNSGITTLTGNTSAGNIELSGILTVAGQTTINANLNAGGSIIPTANLSYDIGSPTNFFKNLYVQGLTQVNTVSLSASASILELNSGLTPGSHADVGILNKYDVNSANAYAYMGLQYATNNLIYKTGIPIDPTAGNSIVVGGSYGNTQFGSQFLSNTTTSTSTTTGALIVAGGAGIAGNLNAGGGVYTNNIVATTANITSATIGTVAGNLSIDGSLSVGGFPVLTPASFPNGYNVYGQSYSGNIIVAPLLGSLNLSSNVSTGGIVVTGAGGIGVGGNINAGGSINAGGNISAPAVNGSLYGTLYGIISTAYTNQPIFTNGLISGFNSGNITVGVLTATNITATGNVVLQQAGTGLWVTSNINAGGYLGSVYGAQPNITQVGTLGTLNVSGNAIIGNIITGTISGTLSGGATTALTVTSAAQSAITSVGTLTSLTVTGNTVVNSTLYSQGVYDNGSRVVSVSSGPGNLSITNGNITLPTIGPGIAIAGNTGYVPVITTDAYGRITSLSNVAIAAVSTTITLNGTSGTGTIAGGSTLSFASTNGVTIAVGTSYANISTPQDIRTSASPSFVSITANVTGNLTGNVTGNLTGNVTGNLTGNVTGNLTGNVTGNVVATTLSGNVTGNLTGNVTGNLTGNVTGNVVATTLSGNVTGTILTAAQPNITSLGIVTGLTVSGAVVPNANASVTLGSTSAWWSSVYGTAVHAQYADLAEMYTSDADYEPGTVLVFGGDAEVTTSTTFADASVAGAVSTNPAYLMNAETTGVAVALRGRVPVKVIGSVRKGDLLVTGNIAGCAASVGKNKDFGVAVFAKAIESSSDTGIKIIQAVIL